MAQVNSLSLARSKDQPGAQDPDDRCTWIPGRTMLGYPRAAVRENDRLDNDREVGIALLDESDTGGGSIPRQKHPTTRETEWHDVNVTL